MEEAARLAPRLKVYLAGGLFNAGQRLQNLCLERALRDLGYEVVLPQREALKFSKNGAFDLPAIVADCQAHCTDRETVFVGSTDGLDADSGTCVEYGMAIVATGRAVIYRTDIRTALDREIGINAMLTAPKTTVVFEPCGIAELSEIEPYFATLARSIDAAIRGLLPMQADS
jgi:nucleoside 2-deoxyribosyltransferase